MRKVIIQNLSITMISKILSFILFILMAKILTEEEYGQLVQITMILSLLPLLHFGSTQGAAVQLPRLFAKKENHRGLFDSYNAFSNVVQLVSGFIVYFVIDITNNYFILIVILNYIMSKYVENVQIYLDSKLDFLISNKIKSLDQICKPLFAILCVLIYPSVISLFFGYLISTFISFVACLYFVNGFGFKVNFKNDIPALFKIGFLVYISWALDMLFRSSDRWFINYFYDAKTLGEYGFSSNLALNIWLLSMSFFSPYASILYNKSALNDYKGILDTVESTNKKLYFLISIVSIIAIGLYPVLVNLIIDKYHETHVLFSLLVVVSILLSINNMYIYYFVSQDNVLLLIKFQVLILIINFFMNLMVPYLDLSYIYFAISTIVSLLLYHIVLRLSFYNDINEKVENLCVQK